MADPGGARPRRGVISVVVPALNERRALPATLARVCAEAAGGEVLVVDGGSDDGTPGVAGGFTGVRCLAAPRGRARQMNAGAAAARGEWLLFLHADTLLPAGALAAIEALPASVQAGGFRHRFSGPGANLRALSLLDNLRCRCTRVIYGDQAMFVRRALFERLGGFPDVPVLEDVRFCQGLAGLARPVLMDAEVITDSRKFVARGVWLSALRCAVIMLCVELGRPIPAFGMRFFEDVR